MTLLDALKTLMGDKGITQARIVCFAYDGQDLAFVSQIETEALVPLLEDWCRKQREIDGKPVKEVVH